MKKNKFFSIIICFLFISLVLLSSLSPKRAYAVEKEDDKDKVYCPLCIHRDDDDPLYKKERQFYQKIHIIKAVYGNSIDEVALAASVLHRYSGPDVAYEKEYDEDFDENNYKNTWTNILNIRSASEGIGLTPEEDARVKANDKIALLTTAAIVMIDSNHGRSYSDVCFKDALAGDKLVDNDGNSGILGEFVNAMVCGNAQVSNLVNPLEYISNFFDGDNIIVAKESAKNRFVNTEKVCKNGFVGGLYSGVSKIKDEDRKKAVKQMYAQQIIDLANYYKRLYGSGVEEYGSSCSANIAGTTGAFASWRQMDPKWKDISLGGSSSVGRAGCLVTSISMQIARSGTKIGSLPSGYSEFNPGAFVTSSNEHDGFAGGGNYAWTGFQTIAPNWGVGDFVSLGVSSNDKLAEAVSRELSSGFGSEQYQKFLVLQIHHATSSQHWVAVNGVENGVVTIFDPARDGTTLDANYENWVVDGYRVMYAKDVPNGQVGSTNNNECSGDAGSGEIQIPSEYGNGGYTVTEIDRFNWDAGTGQRELFDKWMAAGAPYDDGVAVYEGRYLIACTETFGDVGDSIDFYLEDGTKIPAMIFDTKNPDDSDCNKWGHGNGANVLEFEVSMEAFSRYGTNPGYNGWHMEWSGKRVASATNLGGGAAPVNNDGTTSSKGAYCKNGVAYGLRSTGKNDDVAKLAVALAATASPDSQLHAPGHAGTKLNDSRLQDFYDVMYETIQKYPCDDPSNPNSHNECGYNNYALASCAQAAAGVIRATVDSDINSGGPGGMRDYLELNTEKWVLVEELQPSDILDEHCQPGDLLVAATCTNCSGHIAIYVGNKLARVKFPGTNGNVFEANYSSAGYPYINYYNTSGYKFKIFRPTGKGTFTYPFIDISKYLDKYNW